jgi:hypothetical protein
LPFSFCLPWALSWLYPTDGKTVKLGWSGGAGNGLSLTLWKNPAAAHRTVWFALDFPGMMVDDEALLHALSGHGHPGWRTVPPRECVVELSHPRHPRHRREALC